MKKFFTILFVAFFFSGAIAQWNKLPVVISPKLKKDTISIVKYGAVPDGNTLNTKSSNAAIDAANKKGGAVAKEVGT
jgi:polygalacturonase